MVCESTFDTFWVELDKYIEELGPAVHERRHGETMYMPIAISVANLREIITARLEKKFPNGDVSIPSLEWIRLQFWPRNPYAATALHYTGRYNIKYAIQCRQLC